MEQSICKLTLVYPASAEDQIVEALLEKEPPLPGFTSFQADGHGLDFDSASASERVRGRVRRGVTMIILPRERLDEVLSRIATQVPVAHLMHWVEPVESCGRLIAGEKQASPA